MKIIILVFYFLFFSGVQAADKSTFDSGMFTTCEKSCGEKSYDPDLIKKQSVAKQGDLVRCPVSGVVFQLRKGSAEIKHQGRSFHACCSSCAKIFEKSPEKFSKNLS